MMCFGGREDVEAKKSKEIDALIHRDEKVMSRQVKLLLLGTPSQTPQLTAYHPHRGGYLKLTAWANHNVSIGAGESGKSTILKQMRLIYTKDGFTKNEKEEWRVIIFNNILDGLRMTLDAMEEFGIPFEYENSTVRIFPLL
jgi:guanine nucleotide-binding protein subunit alpha, other